MSLIIPSWQQGLDRRSTSPTSDAEESTPDEDEEDPVNNEDDNDDDDSGSVGSSSNKSSNDGDLTIENAVFDKDGYYQGVESFEPDDLAYPFTEGQQRLLVHIREGTAFDGEQCGNLEEYPCNVVCPQYLFARACGFVTSLGTSDDQLAATCRGVWAVSECTGLPNYGNPDSEGKWTCFAPKGGCPFRHHGGAIDEINHGTYCPLLGGLGRATALATDDSFEPRLEKKCKRLEKEIDELKAEVNELKTAPEGSLASSGRGSTNTSTLLNDDYNDGGSASSEAASISRSSGAASGILRGGVTRSSGTRSDDSLGSHGAPAAKRHRAALAAHQPASAAPSAASSTPSSAVALQHQQNREANMRQLALISQKYPRFCPRHLLFNTVRGRTTGCDRVGCELEHDTPPGFAGWARDNDVH